MLRWVAPFVATLAGLYCLVWSIFAAASATRERGGAAFLGMMLLLLAIAQWRVNQPQPQEQ